MSGSCCEEKKFDGVSNAYKRVLWVVIVINFSLFAVEVIGANVGQSQALLADALDFLADGVTYSLSLLVIGSSLKLRAKVALIKGASLSFIACWVLGSTLYHFFVLQQPQAQLMSSIALLALTANLLSVILLMRFRDGDANVRSVWLCSRNDAIGNIAVLVAAGLVWLTQSAWPDLITALIMAALFFSSSIQIIKQARGELQ